MNPHRRTPIQELFMTMDYASRYNVMHELQRAWPNVDQIRDRMKAKLESDLARAIVASDPEDLPLAREEFMTRCALMDELLSLVNEWSPATDPDVFPD